MSDESPVNAENLAAIQQTAKVVPPFFKEHDGVDLAYDAESIEWLDNRINQIHGNSPPEVEEKLITMIGSFFGEALITLFGGEWVDTEYGPGVRFSQGTVAFPFAKVGKQFEGGEGDSIYGLYSSIKPLIALQPPPQE